LLEEENGKKRRGDHPAFHFLVGGGTGPHRPDGGSCCFGEFENERPTGKPNSLFHPGKPQTSIGTTRN